MGCPMAFMPRCVRMCAAGKTRYESMVPGRWLVATLTRHSRDVHAIERISCSTLVQRIMIAMSALACGQGDVAGDKFDHQAAAALNVDQAQECLKHESMLHFPNLAILQPDVAEILATHEHGLDFPALKNLQRQTAAALALCESRLALNSLAHLDDATAAALSRCKAHLELEGLQALTSVPLATKLATQGVVQLPNITDLTGEVIKGFCEVPCHLYLPGIETLDAEAAKAFEGHSGVLDIESLQNAPPEVLIGVLSNKGHLGLGSVTTLGDPAPKELLDALTDHHESVCLNGLANLTPGEAAAIRNRTHRTDLAGIKILQKNVATHLVNCRSILDLTGVVVVEDGVVDILLKHSPKEGTGMVFGANLAALLPLDQVAAIQKHESLHFGNEYQP
jgi:hypothetical protein